MNTNHAPANTTILDADGNGLTLTDIANRIINEHGTGHLEYLTIEREAQDILDRILSEDEAQAVVDLVDTLCDD